MTVPVCVLPVCARLSAGLPREKRDGDGWRDGASAMSQPIATSPEQRAGLARVGRGGEVACGGVEAHLLKGHVEERPASAPEQHLAFLLLVGNSTRFSSKGAHGGGGQGNCSKAAAICPVIDPPRVQKQE